MIPRWLMLVLCASGLAHAAAMPTLDEYVTVAGDNTKSKAPGFEAATEQPNAPIKLTEMRVRSDVALRYARTSVVTHVRNPGRQPQQAVFRMLLPDTAFISGFTMILSGISYKAYVKEKHEAKQIYTQAVSQGVGAAHVATKARDSNHFMVTVNVEGNSTAIFDLRYEEFLVRRNGVYNHAINLHPGVLVPTMEIVVHIKESQKITKLRVPEIRTGNEIDATEKDPQNSKAVIQMEANDQEVTVTFTPDLSEQRRLAGIYVDKTKQKSSLDRYIGYSSDEETNEEDGTVLGQFVVQYDVERPDNGEILVNDGYFVHFLAPKSLPPLSKHAVFVLDTSGSMSGRKIEQLRNAMDAILSDLNPNDYFSIVEFNTYVTVHELKEADETPQRYGYMYYNHVSQAPPALASPENIAKAKVIVSRLRATGITNIYSALNEALNLVRKGVNQKRGTHSTNEIAANIDYEIEKGNELEPVIIFLTDGDPTTGETNTDRIISLISEQNSGDKRASLYSLAFGEDADRSFLRKLSLRNEGFMRHIYEASDAALQLHDFYRQVSSPLLAHVQFLYPSQQIKEGSVSRSQFRTVNAGSEVTVVGKVADDATEITPQIIGICGNDLGFGRKRYEISPRVVVNHDKDEYLPLERLWAYLTIKQLLDKRDAGDDHGTGENSPEKKALDIALTYEFVTPLTSLVVVKPNETNAVDVESADKQSSGTSNAYLPAASSGGGYPRSYAAMPSVPAHDTSNAYVPGASSGGGYFARSYAAMPSAPNYFYTPLSANTLSIRRPSMFLHIGRGRSNHNAIHFGGGGGFASSANSNRYFDSDNDQSWNTPFSEPAWRIAPPATTPVILKSIYTTERPTAIASPKGDYHLEGFQWTSSLLDISNDAIAFEENGTQIVFKLTKDINPPKADGGDVGCLNSTSLAAGSDVGANDNTGSVCVYLTRCFAARTITVDEYKKSSCFVNNSYAGVCCPRTEVDKTS